MGALAIGACSDGDDGGARVDRSDPTATGPATGAAGTAVPGCQPAAGYTNTPGRETPSSPYNGLGTWIDVFDFAPGYAEGGVPAVGPEQVAVMQVLGVKTIYIQAARNDESGLTGITEPDLVGRFLQAAHARGMCVVAWYLPRFADVEADWARLQAILSFEPSSGERFDGVGVDIEFRGDEADPAIRSDRLVQLSQRLRAAAPGLPLGAIVPPPVLMEVVNPDFWPDFPWTRIAPLLRRLDAHGVLDVPQHRRSLPRRLHLHRREHPADAGRPRRRRRAGPPDRRRGRHRQPRRRPEVRAGRHHEPGDRRCRSTTSAPPRPTPGTSCSPGAPGEAKPPGAVGQQ